MIKCEYGVVLRIAVSRTACDTLIYKECVELGKSFVGRCTRVLTLVAYLIRVIEHLAAAVNIGVYSRAAASEIVDVACDIDILIFDICAADTDDPVTADIKVTSVELYILFAVSCHYKVASYEPVVSVALCVGICARCALIHRDLCHIEVKVSGCAYSTLDNVLGSLSYHGVSVLEIRVVGNFLTVDYNDSRGACSRLGLIGCCEEVAERVDVAARLFSGIVIDNVLNGNCRTAVVNSGLDSEPVSCLTRCRRIVFLLNVSYLNFGRVKNTGLYGVACRFCEDSVFGAAGCDITGITGDLRGCSGAYLAKIENGLAELREVVIRASVGILCYSLYHHIADRDRGQIRLREIVVAYNGLIRSACSKIRSRCHSYQKRHYANDREQHNAAAPFKPIEKF